VWAVAWLAVVVVPTSRPAAQLPSTVRDATVLRSVPAPGAVRGLTFAEGQLWSLDARRNDLLGIDPSTGAVVTTRHLEVRKARGLAWDGRSFWCGSDDGRFIHQVDAANGKVLRSLDRRSWDPDSPFTLVALAWDGKYLWGAYEAGLSKSSVARIDVAGGRNVQSFSAQGIPLGLASDGQSLWLATYDVGKGRALLARWSIPEDIERGDVGGYWAGWPRTIVARLPGMTPTGLAWDGGALWYADRKQHDFKRLQLPAQP
jgi:hypothetical protein